MRTPLEVRYYNRALDKAIEVCLRTKAASAETLASLIEKEKLPEVEEQPKAA
jgi:hypothetical protein